MKTDLTFPLTSKPMKTAFAFSLNSKPIKTALTIVNETSGLVIHTFKHCLHAPVAMCITPASVIYFKNNTTNIRYSFCNGWGLSVLLLALS